MIISYYDDVLDYVYGLKCCWLRLIITDTGVQEQFVFEYNDKVPLSKSGGTSSTISAISVNDEVISMLKDNKTVFDNGIKEYEQLLSASADTGVVRVDYEKIVLDIIGGELPIDNYASWINNDGFYKLLRRDASLKDKTTGFLSSRKKFNQRFTEMRASRDWSGLMKLREQLVRSIMGTPIPSMNPTQFNEAMSNFEAGIPLRVQRIDTRAVTTGGVPKIEEIPITNKQGGKVKVKNVVAKHWKKGVVGLTGVGLLYGSYVLGRGRNVVQQPIKYINEDTSKIVTVSECNSDQDVLKNRQNISLTKTFTRTIFDEWFEQHPYTGRRTMNVYSPVEIISEGISLNTVAGTYAKRAIAQNPTLTSYEIEDVTVADNGGLQKLGAYRIMSSTENIGSQHLIVEYSKFSNNLTSKNMLLSPLQMQLFLPNDGVIIAVALRRAKSAGVIAGDNRRWIVFVSVSRNGEVLVSPLVSLGVMR